MLPQNYHKEFTERTKKLLEKYYNLEKREEGYEFTFLMNCLLGLVVVIKENDENISKDFQNFLDTHIGDMTEIPTNITLKEDLENETLLLKDFLRLLRNGIAHQNVEPTKKENIWAGVKFYNLNNGGKGKINFEVVFTQEELRKFALFLANKYLELNK